MPLKGWNALLLTEGQAALPSAMHWPCSTTHIRGTPLPPALCHSCDTTTPSQCTMLPSPKALFLNKAHEGFSVLSCAQSILCPSPVKFPAGRCVQQFPHGAAKGPDLSPMAAGHQGSAKAVWALAQQSTGGGDMACKENEDRRWTGRLTEVGNNTFIPTQATQSSTSEAP